MEAVKIRTYVGRFVSVKEESIFLDADSQLFRSDGVVFGDVNSNVMFDLSERVIGSIGEMEDVGVHESAPYTLISGGSGRFEYVNGFITLPKPEPKPVSSNMYPMTGVPPTMGEDKLGTIVGLLTDIKQILTSSRSAANEDVVK